MTDKLTLRCTGWKQFSKNTLRGIATIQIVELRMTMREVVVHEKNGKTWAQPPSRPWVKDGRVVTDENGKTQYSQLFEFDSAAVRNAFSDAVIRAVLEAFPRAFEPERAAS